MAFRSLKIRAKKSFPILYSFDDTENWPFSNKNATVHYEPPPRSDLSQDVDNCDTDDFGATTEHCKGSPEKSSPSRRMRLLGSLRSLRSLANLHAFPSKTKQAETPRPESPIEAQDPSTTPLPTSPSIATLNFEQSPTARLMFELNMHQRAVSSSSLEIRHSSPMTVPSSARQRVPHSMALPSSTDLPAGTIPDTPGPMQRAFDRDPANQFPWQNTSPTPFEKYVPSTPVLTPLPGTNLSVGDVDPELVLLPPSIHPPVAQISHQNPGYFDISVDEQSHMDSEDMSNGLDCLRLADNYGSTCEEEILATENRNLQVPVGHYGRTEDMRYPKENPRLQDVMRVTHFPPSHNRVLRRMQQAWNLNDEVRTLNLHGCYQVLPLRLKQQGENLADPVRKDSAMSDDWETTSDGGSTTTAAEQIVNGRTPSQSNTTTIFPDFPSATLCGESKTSTSESNPPANLEYLVWDNLNDPHCDVQLENIWGRHTGLYDGTGYGNGDGGPATPYEPDEGTKGSPKRSDHHSNEALTALSVGGECSGKEISKEAPRSEEQDSKLVLVWSPLTADNNESLESVYHAYACSFGGNTPSSCSDSAHGDEQRPVTERAGISSST